jgi:hypothetical protein
MILGKSTRQQRADPVARASQLLSSTDADLTDLDDLIDIIIKGKRWATRVQQDGKECASFVELALAPMPAGMGISTAKRMRPVRASLLALGYYSEWVDLLKATMRRRGRPPKYAAKDNIFRRFWPAPRSHGSIDYILLSLERDYPDDFKAVCDGKEDYRNTAKRLGLSVPSSSKRPWGVSDIKAVSLLSHRAQGDLMCKLCEVVGVDAHCAMLSRVFERRLGPGLAQRWRQEHKENERSS